MRGRILFGFIFIALYSMISAGNGYASNVPKGYTWQKSQLEIHTDTPPALMYVTDSQGNITGANPNLPFDQYGRQNQKLGSLEQIPLSWAEETNIGSDDPKNFGQSQLQTSWSAYIIDGPAQTFTVTLFGIVSGTAQVDVGVTYGPALVLADIQTPTFYALVTAGNKKQLSVKFDPTGHILETRRMVGPEDLPADVQIACTIGQIKSNRLCERLSVLASDIEKDIKDNHNEDARQDLKKFLDVLEDSKEEKENKNEKHENVVQEPANTILKEEAEILLKQLSATEDKDKDRDHDKDKGRHNH